MLRRAPTPFVFEEKTLPDKAKMLIALVPPKDRDKGAPGDGDGDRKASPLGFALNSVWKAMQAGDTRAAEERFVVALKLGMEKVKGET